MDQTARFDHQILADYQRQLATALQRAGKKATEADAPHVLEQLIDNFLRSTDRSGMAGVIEHLHAGGFFTAPASTHFHLSVPGGLALHSYHVCEAAMRLRDAYIALKPEAEGQLPRNSVLIAALLHDVCKMDIYTTTCRNRKDEQGRWEAVLTYEAKYDDMPLGHGEKSVIRLLKWGLELTDDEIVAIRWHMSAWDMPFQSFEMKGNFGAAADNYPLVPLIQAADNYAAHVLEV